MSWTLPYTPQQVAEKALAVLPESSERVALHSNPGPTHTFVNASTGIFRGLIDFGDAYVSHPAWDLWRWNLPDDRLAVLSGYTAENDVDADFLGTWKVVMVISDMMAVAYQMKSRAQSEADLKNWLEQL